LKQTNAPVDNTSQTRAYCKVHSKTRGNLFKTVCFLMLFVTDTSICQCKITRIAHDSDVII